MGGGRRKMDEGGKERVKGTLKALLKLRIFLGLPPQSPSPSLPSLAPSLPPSLPPSPPGKARRSSRPARPDWQRPSRRPRPPRGSIPPGWAGSRTRGWRPRS
jgi:hypothetical protein